MILYADLQPLASPIAVRVPVEEIPDPKDEPEPVFKKHEPIRF